MQSSSSTAFQLPRIRKVDYKPLTKEQMREKAAQLIKHTHAYDRVTSSKGKKQAVADMMWRWQSRQKDLIIYEADVYRRNLYAEVAKPRSPRWKAYHEGALQMDPTTFILIPSATDPVRIQDKAGNVLAYRIRIPLEYTQALATSESLIPAIGAKEHARGTTQSRHWAIWMAQQGVPCLSTDFIRDNESSSRKPRDWLEANKGLFKYLSDIVLRNIDAKMYSKFTSLQPLLSDELQPLCGAWAGCAINQGQTTDGTPHIDNSDFKFGLNVVTGWGDFTTSKLLLWQLGVAIEFQPGDAVLFLGRLFTHNAADIQGGERNIVNCFTHSTVFTWARKAIEKKKKENKDKQMKEKESEGQDISVEEEGEEWEVDMQEVYS